jgi:hypothetical protein
MVDHREEEKMAYIGFCSFCKKDCPMRYLGNAMWLCLSCDEEQEE